MMEGLRGCRLVGGVVRDEVLIGSSATRNSCALVDVSKLTESDRTHAHMSKMWLMNGHAFD